ncbi:MAG: phosphoheptose isomerase [Deltaproteobacteria bacterium]|nr:phosphoheptose isomerase [Deltaproteobacteria bacterium]
MQSRDILRSALDDAASTLKAFVADEENLRAVVKFAETASETLDRGGRIYACGNGGSMSDAMHFVEELSGCFRRQRSALSALAFSDPATLSCIANDFGYDQVFSRQVEAHGRTGDLLVALSTSGESENVVAATRTAREMGLRTVGLLGRGGGKLATEVDLPIIVPRAQTSDRIQEVHLQVLHAVIESIERRLFPENNDVEDPEV